MKTFSLNSFDFRDSLAFLPASLDQCVQDLNRRGKEFRYLKQSTLVTDYVTKLIDKEKYDLLTKTKCFFPYEFLDHKDKLYYPKLPPLEAFQSKLSKRQVSTEDYEEATLCFEKLKCVNLGHYARLYCESDTLQLLDCIAELRDDLHERSQLDIAHYIGIPAFGYDWMLKHTKAEIELITDPEMHYMIERSLRGGLSFSKLRHARVTKPNEHIMLVDVNNQYGQAMVTMFTLI